MRTKKNFCFLTFLFFSFSLFAQTASQQKNGILILVFLNLFFAGAILAILILGKKKFQIQKEYLDEERAKFNAVVTQSDALFWECIFDDESENSAQTNIAQGWIDSDLILAEYIEDYKKVVAQVKSGKEVVSVDLPILQKDAHTHLTNICWKRVVYRAVKKHGAKGVRAIATATDITSQKRAEEEYEGEMSYRIFINNEYPVYIRLDLTNNAVMEQMINIPELKTAQSENSADSELLSVVQNAMYEGQNLSLPATLNRKELLTSFMNGTRSHEWDFYFPAPNGMMRWYNLSVELSSNPYTSCVEANIYMREITNSKIISISKDSVLDEEVEYIFWLNLSNAECRFIHCAKNANWICEKECVDYYELVNSLLEDTVSEKDKNFVRDFFSLKNLTIRLKEKNAADCTFEITTNNLRIAIKQIRSYYLNDNQNVILFVCRDITDITLFQKLQNEKLSRAIEQTEKANASKSDFLSRMSHDLRTPMNGIIGMAELAEDELDKPEAIREDIRKIKSSSKYMLGLLNDILDMSKIESGKLEIRKSRTSAGEMIESITTMASSMCQSNSVNFFCNIDAKKYMNYFINVDRLHLQQVIMNLLSNAAKFTAPGGRIEFLVNILGRKQNAIQIEFVVSDTGSGMSEEFQKVMFDAFTQDVNSVNKVGTGLGLSIVHNLVKLMGGTIDCVSHLNEGTKFIVRMQIEFLEKVRENKEKILQQKGEVNLFGKRILLVEDNPMNQEISRRLLQKKGMVVTIAENGLAALNMFKDATENSFDLILMDVMMPVMGGIDSAFRIRALERTDAKSIPIIALTANAFTEDIEKCLAAGMNTHLAKPINPALLVQTISQYLQ